MKRTLLLFLERIGFMKKMAREGFDEVIGRYASSLRTLDVGSAGRSYYGKWFPNRVSLDIVKTEGVDVVADVHDLSVFKDNEFDVVLCIEALEHFYNPERAISEMRRVLKPQGFLILSTRFIFPLHEVPNDYYRFTEYGLRHLLRNFEIRELKQDGNTMETLSILFQRIGYQCDTLWWKPFKLLWFLGAWKFRLLKRILTREHGDIGGKTQISTIMTSGYIVIAKKP